MLPVRDRIETQAKPRAPVGRWPNPKTAFIFIAASLAFWAAMAGVVLYTA